MKSYELMILTRSDTAADEQDAVIKRVEQWIKDAGGEITEYKPIGVRKLAYPIKKKEAAAFHLWFINAPPNIPAEIGAKVRIDEDVIRHLIIVRCPLAVNGLITGSEV